MTCTLKTSTPTNVELKTPNIPKVDALSVMLIDLPNEVQIVIGQSQLLTIATLMTWSTTRGTKLETNTSPKKINLYLKFAWNLKGNMVLWQNNNQKIVEKP